MSRYGHMVKFNGKYYKPGEEVPDGIQSPKPTNEKGSELKQGTVDEKKKTAESAKMSAQTASAASPAIMAAQKATGAANGDTNAKPSETTANAPSMKK